MTQTKWPSLFHCLRVLLPSLVAASFTHRFVHTSGGLSLHTVVGWGGWGHVEEGHQHGSAGQRTNGIRGSCCIWKQKKHQKNEIPGSGHSPWRVYLCARANNHTML